MKDNDQMGGDNEQQNEVFTLDEALTVVGFGRFQGLVLAYAGLGSMAEAMEVMILSFVGPTVKVEWGLSSTQESLITTVVFAGMLIGAYSWGVISDNFGRRTGLLSVAIVTSICSFLSAFSPNYIVLLILRMLVGVGLGGGPVYSSWFLEFVPAEKRGTWMVIYSTFWTIGTILEASLAWIIMPRFGWRWLLVVSSIPCIVALIFYALAIESPRYLYIKGRISDAHNVLTKIADVNRTKMPSGTLVSDETSDLNDELPPIEHTHLLSVRRIKLDFFKTRFSSVISLFSPRLLKTTLLLWIVFFGNAFSYYGIVLLTSELSNGQSKCGSAILKSKVSDNDSLYRDAFITSFAEVPGIVLAGVVVDRIGRKRSMAFMYALCFIFLLPLMANQKELITTSLLFVARMLSIGTFTVAGLYCPEIYPTAVRSTGVGVASAVGRIGGMICPLVAVELVTNCHQLSAIILFEVVLVLSGIAALLFPFETKGRDLADSVALCNFN